MARTLKREDRIRPPEQRLFFKVEAANYLRVSENTFKKRFSKVIPVVVFDDEQADPLYDKNDLDALIEKSKGLLPDEKID